MATATRKAGNAAKTNTKSNKKKSAAKTPAKIVEKPNRTEADGFTAKETVIETGKSIAQDAKR